MNTFRRIVVALSVPTLIAVSVSLTAPAFAAPESINITVDCTQPISVTADAGDTLVFTLVHPGCNGALVPVGNYANLNNLNGTYYDGATYLGTATGSGFLTYVGHTQGTVKSNDYWFTHGGQDDWYVLQTDSAVSTASVVITTTLAATDGNGSPLVPGSVIADVYTDLGEYLVTFTGPRTLASTGLDFTIVALLGGGAGVAMISGVALLFARRRASVR